MKTLKLLSTFATIAIIALAFRALAYRNLDSIKANAVKTWADSGFTVIGYESYTGDPFLGAHVWYIVRRSDGATPVTYDGLLAKWGGEYHIYNLKALDAVTPQNP